MCRNMQILWFMFPEIWLTKNEIFLENQIWKKKSNWAAGDFATPNSIKMSPQASLVTDTWSDILAHDPLAELSRFHAEGRSLLISCFRHNSAVGEREELERELRNLRENVDECTLTRVDLERKLLTLREELEFENMVHQEVSRLNYFFHVSKSFVKSFLYLFSFWSNLAL